MHLRALALCGVFALPTAAIYAQDAQAQPATPQVPDPTNLANDWWTHLGDAVLDERAARARAFEQRLDALSTSLIGANDEQSKARDLLGAIKTLLKAFVGDATNRQKSKRQPAAKPQPAALEPQSVASLMNLSTTRFELGLELERTKREVNEQDASVNAAKQRVSDALAAYIAKGNQSPDRLLRGLGIVRLRLLWALGVAELGRLKVTESRIEQEHQALSSTLEHGSENLTATEDELERWSAQIARSIKAETQSDTSLAESRLRTLALSDDAIGRAQQRQLQQQLINLDAQRALTTMRHAEADLAHDLSAAALGTIADIELLRAHAKALDEAITSVSKKLSVWRQTTAQERTSANEKLSTDALSRQIEAVNHSRIAQVDATTQTLRAINHQIVRAQLLSKLARAQIVAQGGQVGQLTAQAGEGLRELWNQIQDHSTRGLFTLNDTPVTTLGLLRFSVIVLLAWFVSALARKGFAHLGTRRQNMNQASIYTLRRLFHSVILTIGFFVAFSPIGIDFTKFALIASAFGVGFGFGLQGIFSNFVAGLIIFFERSLGLETSLCLNPASLAKCSRSISAAR
ncbi:MAG: potassium efflux system protein [Gammaproteobacteria bacterium]|jgi:potassium efflux system protein